MSHIGKRLITIPLGIEIEIKKKDNNKIIYIKNKLKIIDLEISNLLNISIIENKNKKYLSLEPLEIKLYGRKNHHDINKIWGLTRSLIYNTIKGLNQGFIKKLLLVGIGYKARLENKILILKLGHSHLINFKIPDTIEIIVNKPIIISIMGQDKNLVNATAAIIRSFRKPEPYNGKGIRYIDEKIILKEKSN